MARTNQRGRTGNRGNDGGRNNNPEGRNQYSGSMLGWSRERPVAAAAAAAGAVAAGVFLWSRRNQISDQISDLGDQLNEWRDGMGSSDSTFAGSSADDGQGFIARSGGRTAKSQSDIAEEALTLKQTGKKSKRPLEMNEQTKVGSTAF
jgi:hypothetical protein